MPASRLRKESQGSVRPADNAFRELIRTFGVAERVMQPYFARFGISGAVTIPSPEQRSGRPD